MRTLGFRTHVLLTLAAAAGVVAALARPWYDAPPAAGPDTGFDGPLYTLADTLGRWTRETAGTSGWEALGPWGAALAALAGVTALGALGCLLPAIQGVAREVVRYASLGCFALAAWKLLDAPGPNAELEPRYGVFVAALAALVAVMGGTAVAAAPLRSR